MAVETFVEKTLDLLDKERLAEIQETQVLLERLSSKELERRGVCLRKLQLSSHRSGLYGRMVAVFEPESRHSSQKTKIELPANNFSPGDIVGVGLTNSSPTDKPLSSGIVLHMSAYAVSVAFEETQDVLDLDDTANYKLTKLANDVTYRRLKTNLQDLLKYRDGPSRKLIDVCFCLEEASGPGGDFPFTFVNNSLDKSQQEAVKFALVQRELAIIHGPPGTGKTTTVVEIILQSVAQGLKILVTAPSNIAVDNLLERLASSRPSPRLVRLGHPARLMQHLTKFSLDAVVSASEEKGIVNDVRADIQKTLSKLKKTRGAGERRALRDDLKHLRSEVSQREEKATADILSRAQVVLATLTSATLDGPLKHLKDTTFDLVVIDECSQALEAACWIGLLRGRRCVLAGDHLQLPPTILSKEAASAGLELTLMERLLTTLVEEKGKDIVRMLTTQYRMHQDIMDWASQQLYQGKLQAHSSVASHLLRDLTDVDDTEETRTSLLLIDTAGCDLQELNLPEEVSKGNEGEADVVAFHVESLVKSGVKPKDIAVIAPYNMQVDLLRARLCPNHPGLEVKSVDGFQGREKEAVVISMVRSNSKGEIGFLAEKRRINVAVTRARRHLAVVCDSDTVCHDPFIASLVGYMMDHGDVVSAHQILEGTSAHVRPSRWMDTTSSPKASIEAEKKNKQTKSRSSSTPLVSKEEKADQYRQQLEEFVADTSRSTLDFPASLNSHDRMVIHEVAGQLGLGHNSVGEGKERHICVTKLSAGDACSLTQVSKHTDTEPASTGCGLLNIVSRGDDTLEEKAILQRRGSSETINAANEMDPDPHIDEIGSKPGINEDKEISQFDLGKSSVKSARSADLSCKEMDTKVESTLTTQIISQGTQVSASLRAAGDAPKSVLTDKQNTAQVSMDTLVCPHCKRTVPTVNSTLHQLHCSKQGQSSSNSQQPHTGQPHGGSGARKKENVKNHEPVPVIKQKKEKVKPKVSHVQKASEVLSKIPDDDFDALISTITALDGKCAFKKCKTLTTTLGRNCVLCDRRFCLTHLTPEVHGCGQAAKEQARRTISREGVLHSGSGVPDKQPNAARRTQLELRMEKKKAELTQARSRKTDKSKS